MFCFIVLVVCVVSSSNYAKCTITMSSMHKFTFFQHLAIFLKSMSNRTTLFHQILIELHYVVSASVTFPCYPELCNSWGCLLGQFHYAISKVRNLSSSQNCIEMTSMSKLNCAFLKQSHQASFWFVGTLHYTKTWVFIDLQNCVDMSY